MGKIKKIRHMIEINGIGETLHIFLDKFIYHLGTGQKVKKLKEHMPPIKSNRLVFMSNPDYSDNARVLSDFLVDNGYLDKYEIIWLVSEPDKYRQYAGEGLRFVREKEKRSGLRTLEAYEAVLTAKMVFFTHSVRWVREQERRKEQLYINLWHGCGYKAAKGGSDHIHFDYVLVPGDVFVDTKAEFFQCDKRKILPIGYPRYDLMLTGEVRRDIRERIGGGEEDKVILWMPTYRQSTNDALSEDTLTNELNLPIIEDVELLKDFDECCRRNHVIIYLKRHPMQREYHADVVLSNIRIIDDAFFDELGLPMYEFLRYTDALLTDYSSIAIDYLLLDKQLGFTLDDYERYKESRGFVFENPLDYMPGWHIYNMDQMERFIEAVANDRDDWGEQRRQVKQLTHNVQKDGYCSHIIKTLGL